MCNDMHNANEYDIKSELLLPDTLGSSRCNCLDAMGGPGGAICMKLKTSAGLRLQELMAGYFDGNLRMWDTRTGRVTREVMDLHQREIVSVSIGKRGSKL